MAYTPQNWDDSPATDTPLDAARLNYMETGIAAASATAISAAATAGTINGVTVTGTPSTGQVPTATSSSTATWQTPTGGGGGGGASTAAAVSYDPTTSTGGDPNTPMIQANDVQGAFDWINRDITDRIQQAYIAGVRDAMRLVEAKANASPQVTTEGTFNGFVAMPGQPTATGQALKVLSGAGTQASPWVYGWA